MTFSEFLACFQRNFLSLSPVMTASSPKFFLQKALAASMERESGLKKYCVSLYMIHPSSVVLYTGNAGGKNSYSIWNLQKE